MEESFHSSHLVWHILCENFGRTILEKEVVTSEKNDGIVSIHHKDGPLRGGNVYHSELLGFAFETKVGEDGVGEGVATIIRMSTNGYRECLFLQDGNHKVFGRRVNGTDVGLGRGRVGRDLIDALSHSQSHERDTVFDKANEELERVFHCLAFTQTLLFGEETKHWKVVVE